MNEHLYIPASAGSKGFALFCHIEQSVGWTEGLRFINDAGFGLSAPNAEGMVITVEPTGDRLDRTLAEFQQLADAGGTVIFKVWTPGGDDMLCEFRHDKSTKVELYWFGQLETDDEKFVSSLLYRFKNDIQTKDAIVIVDWHAISENFDWIAFLSGRVVYSGVPPEILGLPSRLSSLTRLDLRGFTTEQLDHHVLHARAQQSVHPVTPPEEEAMTRPPPS